jgi:hypothetical protein
MKFYDIETTGRVKFIETEHGGWARRSDIEDLECDLERQRQLYVRADVELRELASLRLEVKDAHAERAAARQEISELRALLAMKENRS